MEPNASIDIITGPMFSGKSTELLRRLSIFSELGLRVLYVTSIYDTRTIISHNKMISTKMLYDNIKITHLGDIENLNYDVIGIDEAQFFDDLYPFCVKVCDQLNKKVIVAGLNSDYRRERFGQITDLFPICDTVCKLDSFCNVCKGKGKISKAIFTKRIVKNNDIVFIGASESYISVCRDCYK